MHKLINFVCDELEEIEEKADKGELSISDVQYADTLAHLKKNLLKSEKIMEELDDGYSSDMRPMYDGYYRRDGSYARGRGTNARRDGRGRYSRDPKSMAEELRRLMSDTSDESVKRDIEKLLHKVEQT